MITGSVLGRTWKLVGEIIYERTEENMPSVRGVSGTLYLSVFLSGGTSVQQRHCIKPSDMYFWGISSFESTHCLNTHKRTGVLFINNMQYLTNSTNLNM